MAGYTKADYDALYSIRVSRHFGGTAPGETQVRCNYHKWAMVPILATRWKTLQAILNFQATDKICVIGAGFGWGVDALIAESGALVVGIDVSDYIATEQGNTEEVELRAAITTAGLNPDSGKGATILAGIYDGLPRSNVVVLQSDASAQNERQLIRTALDGWPTHVVYEDIVDDAMTDQEITFARNAGNGFGGAQTLIWVYTPTEARSAQALATLTGDLVIESNGKVTNP